MFVLAILIVILALLALGVGLMLWSQKPKVVKSPINDIYGRKTGEFSESRDSSHKVRGRWITLGGALGLFLGLMFLVFSSFYTQEAGEAKVLRDWTGNIVGSEVASGGHWKAPWVDTVDWNIRNQDVMFTGDGKTSHNGQQVTGAEISFTDRDGVSGNLDIQVIYSIKASAVEKLTFEYTGQEDFATKVVENDVKSLPRDVISTYTTINVYNERAELRSEIEKRLQSSWKDKGVEVDKVNLQGIRYPKDVEQRFKDAQNAQTDLLKADTEAKTAKTKADGEAQAEIARANGEAQANQTLSQSLTPQVLQQRWIDALSKANTIIVPNDFTGLGNLNGIAK